jgi:hypothetical protein
VWVLEWVARAIRAGLHGLWDAPIFFPVRGALALSDHLLGPAALAALLPPGHAVVVYNVVLLLSFPAAGLAAAYVFRRSGLPPLAAWLGGLVFAFSPYRWASLSHLQMLLTACIPLLLWLWDRLLEQPRARTAIAFVALYAVHMLGGAYLAYMVHVPLLVVTLVRAAHHRRELLRWQRLRVLVPTVLAAAGVALAVYTPYVLIGEQLGIARSRREMIAWGATLVSYLTPSWRNLYAGGWMEGFARPENELFAGFLPTALAGLGLVVLAQRSPHTAVGRARRAVMVTLALGAIAALLVADRQTLVDGPRARYLLAQWLLVACATGLALVAARRPGGGRWRALSPWERSLLVTTLTCALLTLPIAFLPLARVLPGLAGMRVPSRFYAFVSLGVAWLAAIGFAALRPRLRQRGGLLVALGMAVLLVVDVVPVPIYWAPVPNLRHDVPNGHRWLARHAGEVHAYLELPMDNPTLEIEGMYYQTTHWIPSVNGYSGYFPHAWARVRDCCASTGMGSDELATLRDEGVTHLLISGWKLQPENREIWMAFARRLLRQRVVKWSMHGHGDTVLEILPPNPEAAEKFARAQARRAAAAAERAAAGSGPQ